MISKFTCILAVVSAIPLTLAAPTGSLFARAGAPDREPIHPGNDATKCIGISGGTYANGTLVDIYDCNKSMSQLWQLYGTATDAAGKVVNQTITVTPQDNSARYCLDAGNVDELADGANAKIWKCIDGAPQQQWTLNDAGQIALSVGGYCLDLTNGDKTNRNRLQLWKCVEGNKNQVWTL